MLAGVNDTELLEKDAQQRAVAAAVRMLKTEAYGHHYGRRAESGALIVPAVLADDGDAGGTRGGATASPAEAAVAAAGSADEADNGADEGPDVGHASIARALPLHSAPPPPRSKQQRAHLHLTPAAVAKELRAIVERNRPHVAGAAAAEHAHSDKKPSSSAAQGLHKGTRDTLRAAAEADNSESPSSLHDDEEKEEEEEPQVREPAWFERLSGVPHSLVRLPAARPASSDKRPQSRGGTAFGRSTSSASTSALPLAATSAAAAGRDLRGSSSAATLPAALQRPYQLSAVDTAGHRASSDSLRKTSVPPGPAPPVWSDQRSLSPVRVQGGRWVPLRSSDLRTIAVPAPLQAALARLPDSLQVPGVDPSIPRFLVRLPVLPKPQLHVPPLSELARQDTTAGAAEAVGNEAVVGNAARLALVGERQAGAISAPAKGRKKGASASDARPERSASAMSLGPTGGPPLTASTSSSRLDALHALRRVGTYQSPLEKAHADIQAARARETMRVLEQVVARSADKEFDGPFSSLPSFWPAGVPRRGGSGLGAGEVGSAHELAGPALQDSKPLES